MIPAKHHPLLLSLFRPYIFWRMRRRFRPLRIQGRWLDRGGPVLLIGNHFSWWDGFFGLYLNQRIFKRKLHVMMLEEQLKNRMFLSRLGAFSIKKNARSALESLYYARALLDHRENLLLLFPQGRFESQHRFPLRFEKGWFRILHQPPKDLQVVFMACLPDYFEQPRPSLDIYITQAPPPALSGHEALAGAYNDFLLDAIEKQQQR